MMALILKILKILNIMKILLKILNILQLRKVTKNCEKVAKCKTEKKCLALNILLLDTAL